MSPSPRDLCGGRTRAGGACGRPAGWGTGHAGVGRCKLHGGASPQAELSGALELARRQSMVMGTPVEGDPAEAILECVAIARGEVAYATARIAELQAEDAAAPVLTTVDRPLKEEKGAESDVLRATELHTGAPMLNVWIRTRREAMDRVVSYSSAALKAGVEERTVRLAERQAGMLAEAMRAMARLAGLDPDEQEVRTMMRRSLLAARDVVDGVAAEVQ